VPNFVFAHVGSLPAPSRADFDVTEESPLLGQTALTRVSWPDPSEVAPGNAAVALAAPASSLFEIEGGLDVALHGAAMSRRVHRTVSAAPGPVSKRLSRREARRQAFANSRQARLAHASDRQTRRGEAQTSRQKAQAATTARRGPVKRLVQVRKRRV
jgi:hypothetical protein